VNAYPGVFVRPRRSRDRARVSGTTWILSLGLALALGLFAGSRPVLAAASVIGIAFAAVVLANITAGLMVFTVVTFLESLPTIQGGPSLAKLFGLFLVAGWAVALVYDTPGSRSSRDFVRFSPALVCSLVLFLAWVVFSFLWAENVGIAQGAFFRYALNFTLFPIVFAAIREQRHVVWLYAVFVAGGLITSAVGALAPQAAGNVGERLGGAGVNPNELGGLAATAAVMAAVLACTRGLSVPARITALVASFLSAISLIMTETRGAVVGLAAAMVAAPFLAGRGRRLAAAGAVTVLALGLVFWLSAFAPQNAVKRITDFGPSGSGRSDLWTIGLRMVEDKPVTGVGAGNFPVSSVHYLLEPGTIVRDEFIVDVPKETHNIFLQVLSELGVVGLALFLAIVAYCMASALDAARAFARARAHVMEMLSRGIVLGLVALLIASAFTTELYSKQLYLLLATGPALRAMARRRETEARAVDTRL
jgi:putative inorganic carbon (HCO3(-)) transporter